MLSGNAMMLAFSKAIPLVGTPEFIQIFASCQVLVNWCVCIYTRVQRPTATKAPPHRITTKPSFHLYSEIMQVRPLQSDEDHILHNSESL